MQESVLSTVGLPIALAIIMLGLGLHLRVDDFKRVLTHPKAMLVGLLCQMLLLPAVCYFLCKAMNLTPALAVGMMLLAASPGGTTANLYSYLFKGDVALNISLTAINSALAILTIPLIVNFALESFMGETQYIPLQFKKVLEVIVIVLLPVALGMWMKAKKPELALKMDKPVKIASALILLLLVLLILMRERELLWQYFQAVGAATLLFNLISLLTGYFAGKMVRLPEEQNRAIAFEIGIHNGTLAIYLALAVLHNCEMSIPPAVYSLIMFFTAALFGWWLNRKSNIVQSN